MESEKCNEMDDLMAAHPASPDGFSYQSAEVSDSGNCMPSTTSYCLTDE